MSFNQDTIDELIVSFLSGEATSEEQHQLRQWIESAEERGDYFRQMRDSWLSSAQIGVLPTSRVEQAWEKLK
ncbi:MAG: FecR family protein, partial [Dysgonamonadaceae bacterium]|nr:FecR family protein [Dysgonamonadaceae bacterium]